MKQYYITSLYSQNMQVATQQDHAIKRMIREMKKPEFQDTEESRVWDEYLHEHETTICLGVSQPTEILALYAFLKKHENVLRIPKGIFQEQSLNHTPTAVSFVTNTKLSHPIAKEIYSIFKDYNIRSFYDFKKPITMQNFQGTMVIKVDFKDSKPIFHIEFFRDKFKSTQNEELIPKDLSDEYLDEVYKDNFYEDYCFHEGIDYQEVKSIEQIEETYSIEEIVFLDMVSRLNLKK